ncbi:aldehyde dehydrogenase [Ophiostoma piceae UAMH 11346]|uniref:Aldehyde dehydrogenase n=1 Tax=Ophiostoma piceae (strain UAMH 11346) TaxID=1262450 RepID=S3C198_OPHP1|nr:aldehyde dehydrogenase [Ophiostoma piceae UAMH 11346]
MLCLPRAARSLTPSRPVASQGLNTPCRCHTRPPFGLVQLRNLSSSPGTALETRLTAPNGKTWTQPLGLFINNEFVKSSTGETIESINPSTEDAICSVQAASAQDIDTAVKAARRAFRDPSWRKLSGTERGALMHRLADLVGQHAELLATIEALDNGKPYATALAENVPEFQNVLRYYAGFADKNFGQVIDVGPNKMAYTIKEPLGVCGQIIPWNYPLDMAAWKLGPALSCGNTVVLKLAEQTPLSMLYLAQLIRDAGFPPGVVNIVNGTGRDAGAALVQHADVDKIAFTGSTATGREIMKMAAGTLKNVTLETGGKSPLLVFEDADIELAAFWAHIGIMSNQGQICSSTSRILVHESVHDRFVESFKQTVKRVSVVGDPFDPATFQGPQVTRAQYERVLGYIASGREEGATVAYGGEPLGGPLKSGGGSKGFFVAPTVFTNVKPTMKIYKEEIFGPCVAIVSFRTEDEALEMANDTTYGLGAAVFTKDMARAHRVARDIEAGMVWINSSNDSDYRVPFGGVKQSGIGRELGEAGLAAYSNVKSVHLNMDV